MQTVENKRKSGLHFTCFSLYAKFLLDNRLPDFVREHLRIAKELELPLLQYLSFMTEDELLAMSTGNARELLEHIAANKADDHIEASKHRWLKDQLPHISREKIIARDIAGVSYTRKQAFLK
ncbi:MAG: hypothetical protein WCF67_15345, partial [Chitinophagaceae bacterium]